MKYLIIIGLVFIAGCREVYDPETDTDETVLVIEGLMTNNNEISVKLTTAAPFDSSNNYIPVRGANVFVYDDSGNMFTLTENQSGIYVNSELSGIPGRKYSLKVIKGAYTYESSPQIMPETYKQDSIYGERITHTIFIPTSYGDYIKAQEKGIETFIDLSSGSSIFPKCKYEVKTTVLYFYIDIDAGLPPPTVYGWKTFNPNLNLNITTSRFEKSKGLVIKHSISFFREDVSLYTPHEGATIVAWLLSIKKYSMSAETYQYYLKIHDQLEASGKIFDPVPSQINGNMKCTSHPEKKVFGFFEVSNVEKLYYRLKSAQQDITIDQEDEFEGINDEGEMVSYPPSFWN